MRYLLPIMMLFTLLACDVPNTDGVLTPRQMAMLYRDCKPLPIMTRLDNPRCQQNDDAYHLMEAQLYSMRNRVQFGQDILLAQMELGRRFVALDIARKGKSDKINQFEQDVREQHQVVNAKLGALHFEILLRGEM